MSDSPETVDCLNCDGTVGFYYEHAEPVEMLTEKCGNCGATLYIIVEYEPVFTVDNFDFE